MTYQSKAISKKVPDAFLEVSKELAMERGIEDGTKVKLTSPYGQVKVKCLVTDRVKGKEVYLPMNTNGEASINYLTSSHSEKDTYTPAYKEVSAKMEILEPKGESPLPSFNSRYGNPKPQIGVRVEDKWKRDDYIFPGDLVRKSEVNSNG